VTATRDWLRCVLNMRCEGDTDSSSTCHPDDRTAGLSLFSQTLDDGSPALTRRLLVRPYPELMVVGRAGMPKWVNWGPKWWTLECRTHREAKMLTSISEQQLRNHGGVVVTRPIRRPATLWWDC